MFMVRVAVGHLGELSMTMLTVFPVISGHLLPCNGLREVCIGHLQRLYIKLFKMGATLCQLGINFQNMKICSGEFPFLLQSNNLYTT